MAHSLKSDDRTHVTPELLQMMKNVCYISHQIVQEHSSIDPDVCASESQTDLHNILWCSPAQNIAHSLMTLIHHEYPHNAERIKRDRFLAAWPVMYSLKWTNVTDVSGFQQNSTHCEFAKMNVSYKKHDFTFFIKAASRNEVMDRSVDNPILDSVNGKILRKIMQAIADAHIIKQIQEHTIMYETSFNCINLKNQPTQKIGVLPLHQMMDLYHESSPFSLSFPPSQPYDFVFASVFEYIPGKSVADILKAHDEKGIRIVLNGLCDFWHTMSILGLDYGMLHNDLHAGNIFFNSRSGKLMLIDYGQMTFPFDIEHVINESIDDIAKDESCRNDIKELSYKDLIGNKVVSYKRKSSAQHDSAHFYTTHILDLATCMTNIYSFMSNTLDTKWLFFNELIKFDRVRELDIDGKFVIKSTIQIKLNVESCIRAWYNAMVSIDNAQFLSDLEKRSMKLIGEGLFFMCLILIPVLWSKGLLTSSVHTFTREQLANHRIMHWGFQVNQHLVNEYVNTTNICRVVLDVMSNMENSVHIIAYLFLHSMLLKKMKTPNPSPKKGGGNKQTPMSNTEPTVKEWIQRYKYLDGEDMQDDASLQSLANKDNDNVSISSLKNSTRPSRSKSIAASQFSVSQQLVTAYGGRKKRTGK
jgi:serine/threonine protein kinase